MYILYFIENNKEKTALSLADRTVKQFHITHTY